MFRASPLGSTERVRLLGAFLGVCEWTQLYYLWGPNLRDEADNRLADNRLIELAVAGAAAMIVTNNVRDFQRPELRFPSVRIVAPKDLRKELA